MRRVISLVKKLIGWNPPLPPLPQPLPEPPPQSPFLTRFPPGHYLSPLPDYDEVMEKYDSLYDRKVKDIPGVTLREQEQLALVETFAPLYPEFPFPPKHGTHIRYYYPNMYFGYGDAIMLYNFLRHFQPKRVIEVGSGFSSALMLDVNELYLDNSLQFTFIEPYPERLFELLSIEDRQRHTVIQKTVQQVPLELFAELCEEDFLFLDSTHVLKIGSDTAHLFYQVLPRLKKGVFVHFHDIFWPFEYPKDWYEMGFVWNEAHLLRAFLQFNDTFEVVLSNAFLWEFNPELMNRRFPLSQFDHGCSIWLRKSA